MQGHASVYDALPGVLEEAKDTPVIAAGGIGNGTGIYKALAAGAGGALLGTRFVATVESNAHDEYKKTLTATKGSDTALSMCWQGTIPQLHRAVRNSTFEAWEVAGCPPPGKRPGENDFLYTRADGFEIRRYFIHLPLVSCKGKLSEGAMYAGLGVGEVKDVPPAGELVKRLWAEAGAAYRTAR